MFRLSKENCSRCQIGTLTGKRGEHLKYMPYAFTENGIAMLSSVLKSKTAIDVNIRITRAEAEKREGPEMTLDEINAEIAAARAERHARERSRTRSSSRAISGITRPPHSSSPHPSSAR